MFPNLGLVPGRIDIVTAYCMIWGSVDVTPYLYFLRQFMQNRAGGVSMYDTVAPLDPVSSGKHQATRYVSIRCQTKETPSVCANTQWFFFCCVTLRQNRR